MKLSGRHMVSPQSLLLLAACLTCEGFKFQGASLNDKITVSDMEGAANVAQIAYQQGHISTNTWKAMRNVSCFLEAARSSGLDWTESEAQKHIIFTANGLTSKLQSNSSAVAVRGKGISMEMAIDANNRENDKGDLQGAAFEATASIVTNWVLTGKPPSTEDLTNAAMGVAIMAIGMANPLLGAVTGMAWSFVSSVLFPNKKSPMQTLAEQLKKEVGIMIEQSQVQAAIEDAGTDLHAVLDELEWMPDLLGGVYDGKEYAVKEKEALSDDQKRLLLTYNIMIQHDLAKIAYKIQQSKFGQAAEVSKATNQWSAAMFPLAEQLILLQTNLLIDIGAHEIVAYPDGAAERISVVLRNWRWFIIQNIYKVHLFNSRQAVKTLGWEVGDRKFRDPPPDTRRRDNSNRRRYTGKWNQKECTYAGTDACKAMDCRGNYWYNCGPDEEQGKVSEHPYCDGGCNNWTAWDFYWQYVAPKVEKIQKDVENMQAAVELGHPFEKVGNGYCSGTRFEKSTENDSKACAAKCQSHKACNFFFYNQAGGVCSQYGGTQCASLKRTDLDYGSYRKRKDVVEKWQHKSRCTGYPIVSDCWAVSNSTQKPITDFDSDDFKKWVDVAWAKCLDKDPHTQFVEVRSCAAYKCARSCNRIGYEHGSVWKVAVPREIQMVKKGWGKCVDPDFDHEDWFSLKDEPLLLRDQKFPTVHFESAQYMAMVRQAWHRCHSKHQGVKSVSVWAKGGFFCYKKADCKRENGDLGVQTWELAN